MSTDTLIGRDLTTDRLVRMNLKSRFSGLYVIGKPGRGKSNLLLSLIVQDLYQGHGLCVLDPHGDLTTDILAAMPPHREHEVTLLDLQDTNHLFAFDLFAGVDPNDPLALALGEERVVGIFKKVWGDVSWGPRMEDLLANAVHVLFMNPGTTLADLPPLLTDPSYRQLLLTRVTNEHVLKAFRHEYDPLTVKAQAGIYGPVMNKLRAFLRHALLGPIVSQPGATVDFSELMAKRRILLVRLSSELEEATSLLGTAVVLRLFETALQRKNVPESQRPPFCLYADEFGFFATPTFGKLLEQVRKYRVATTIAHQRRAQLSSELKDAVTGAVNIVSFQVTSDDAREMAREYVSKPQPPVAAHLFSWAGNHSDPVIRDAVDDILRSIPFVTIRYDEEGGNLSIREKVAFVERRLRQAVKDGNSKATAFPPAYWYGTYDLQQGDYARLADGFAVLRDRLLAPQRIGADELTDIGIGIAAAKLEQEGGKMRQFLLQVPLAITPEHSTVVKMLMDHEGPVPETWPDELTPTHIEAGLRARRIRDGTRRRYTRASTASRDEILPPVTPPVVAAPAAPAPPVSPGRPTVQFEVEIE